METTVAGQCAEKMDDPETLEFLYYNYSSDSETDDQYDACTTNQANISPCDDLSQNESTNGQKSVDVNLLADEFNALQQSMANILDVNANYEPLIQPATELDDDFKMPCNPNDDPICNGNEQRAEKEMQTDCPVAIDAIPTIDLISDDEEKILISDVSDAPGPSVPRVQRPRKKINKKQKSINAEQIAKEYKCGQCKFSSKGKWDLATHIRTHSGERPYECEYCEKRFIRKAHLDHHVKSVHSELFEFHCSKCRLGFKEKSSLTSHEMHCSKKQLVCDYCNRNFDHKGRLREHMRWHSNEMPFRCFKCKKGFKRNSSLNRHIKCCH